MEPPNAANNEAWDNLIPIGRGFVNISNPELYHLRPGIETDSGVDRYSVAMVRMIPSKGISLFV